MKGGDLEIEIFKDRLSRDEVITYHFTFPIELFLFELWCDLSEQLDCKGLSFRLAVIFYL